MEATREKILEGLNRIEDLPSIPEVVTRVTDLIVSTRTSAEEVANVISDDPAMVSQVLKVVNSSYFGPVHREITSVKEAVTRVGFSEISRICLAVGVVRVFKGRTKSINYRDFWKHCIAVGLTTNVVFGFSGLDNDLKPPSDTLFTAGLLHDVGALVLDQYFHAKYDRVQSTVEETGKTPWEVEKDMLGLDHAEIGGHLLTRWNFPETIIQGVNCHHEPDACPEEHRLIAQLTHFSDYICNNQGFAFFYDGISDKFSYGGWHDLGLKVEQAPDIINAVREKAEKSKIFAMILG